MSPRQTQKVRPSAGAAPGQTTSPWQATQRIRLRPRLTANLNADVCVIGAGIAGLSTAYSLVAEGRSVIVLDGGAIGGGQTGRTTAHLSHAMDVQYETIRRFHGDGGAALAAESHTAAIDRMEVVTERERIDCDFARLDGFLFTPAGSAPDALDAELAAVHAAGLTRVERLARAPWPSYETGPCLRFPDQAQFHPLKYLAGLAAAVEQHGGRIFCRTRAATVTGGSTARVETTTKRTVTAGAVVVATNTPIVNLVAIHTKQVAYLTYVIGLRVSPESVPAGLFWDTEDPYHYVRLHRLRVPGRRGTHDVLIVGGEDHRTGQADDAEARFGALEKWARERVPSVDRVDFRWSGQVMNSLDGLAFIGANPGDEDNVYVVTGDTGMGMTHGTIAGLLLTDLIMGRANPWSGLYDPSRLMVRAAPSFLAENFNTAVQYTDWLTAGVKTVPKEIERGHGAVIRRGLGVVAAYRDPDGRLHERSAVCPHLGCVVAWNSSEHTWDCPCHGSRFDATGRVISGPANVDLPAASD
jgi:glycine/D-amino acid oxidase-like deaminating enzyme/nitrite reductase/ring-hydroxylating ferredoxin subunit